VWITQDVVEVYPHARGLHNICFWWSLSDIYYFHWSVQTAVTSKPAEHMHGSFIPRPIEYMLCHSNLLDINIVMYTVQLSIKLGLHP